MGAEVPYSYYMSNSAPVAKDYMETLNLIAGVGGWKKLKYKVDVENSILRYVNETFTQDPTITQHVLSLAKMGIYDGRRRHWLPSLLQESRRGQWRFGAFQPNRESSGHRRRRNHLHQDREMYTDTIGSLIQTSLLNYLISFGVDVIMFDNTFSILRPKKLRYYIVVDPPAPGSLTAVASSWETRSIIVKCFYCSVMTRHSCKV